MALPQPVKYEEIQREALSARPSTASCPGRSKMRPEYRHITADRQRVCSAYRAADTCMCAAAVVLKPELFEGLRFDFTKPLNQNFALSHRRVLTRRAQAFLISQMSEQVVRGEFQTMLFRLHVNTKGLTSVLTPATVCRGQTCMRL